MLFLRGGVSALGFDLLQGGDCLDVAPEFLLCTACAEIIVHDAVVFRRRQRRGRVNLRLIKTQSANLHIIGEVVFVGWIHRHGFLGVSRSPFRLRIPLHEPCKTLPALRTRDRVEKRWVAERNIKKPDALNNERLAVFQIHRIAYGIRERFSLRDRSRFGSFLNCFLRRVPSVLLHILIRNMNEVAEIEIFQLVGNKLLQRAVLAGFQMLVVQIAFQSVIHKVDIHLNGNLIVGDGGVGDTDFRRVAEIRLRAVFAPAEVGDQSLCPFYKRLFRLPLQLQPVCFRLPFACKFLCHAVIVHIVAVGLVIPHGVQGTESPVKAHHMEAVCGVEGRFFLLCLSFLRRDPLHIRHNLPDEGAVAISFRIHNLPIYNTAFSKRFPDGDGVNIVKVVLFLLGVEVIGLNELRNAPLHLRP